MWYDVIKQLESENQDYVLVTVLGTRGSTPRDCGTKMIVSRTKSYATIGGGHLEFKAIEQARKLLTEQQSQQKFEHLNSWKPRKQSLSIVPKRIRRYSLQ